MGLGLGDMGSVRGTGDPAAHLLNALDKSGNTLAQIVTYL